MGLQIGMERKGYEWIGCWTDYVTLAYGLTRGLKLGFSW